MKTGSAGKTTAALIKWEPAFSVNVAEIDRQHQAWFTLINGVYVALLNGAGKEILRTLLAETTQYAFAHFAREEELMDQCDYPARAEHIKAHENLSRRAREVTDRLEGGETVTLLEYLVFLSDWVKEHTTTIDRRLGEYLRTEARQ